MTTFHNDFDRWAKESFVAGPGTITIRPIPKDIVVSPQEALALSALLQQLAVPLILKDIGRPIQEGSHANQDVQEPH